MAVKYIPKYYTRFKKRYNIRDTIEILLHLFVLRMRIEHGAYITMTYYTHSVTPTQLGLFEVVKSHNQIFRRDHNINLVSPSRFKLGLILLF